MQKCKALILPIIALAAPAYAEPVQNNLPYAVTYVGEATASDQDYYRQQYYQTYGYYPGEKTSADAPAKLEPAAGAVPVAAYPPTTQPEMLRHEPDYQQYAMRPPASVYDSGVPYPQANQIREQNAYQPEIPPVPEQQPTEEVEEEESEKILGGAISGSAGVTTDYSFRGITQTREKPAVQAGVEYEHSSGVYIGLWGSNVDFGSGAYGNIEGDAYAGYRAAITDEIGVDAGVLYYAYPGVDSDLDYNYYELYLSGEYTIPVNVQAGGGFGADNIAINAAFYYAPKYFGDTDKAYYAKLGSSIPVGHDLTVDGHIGKQWFAENDLAGYPDYLDWAVGIAYGIGDDYEVKVEYVDTDLDKNECSDGCDAKAIGTLSKSF